MQNPANHWKALSIIAMITMMTHVWSCESPDRESRHCDTKEFPNAVGSVWFYEILDSNGEVTDTAKVEIVGEVQIKKGECASIWKHQRSDSIWYRYFRVKGKRVIEYPQLDGVGANTLYTFPLGVGKRWISNPAWNDISLVVGIDSVTHPAFADRHSYHIVRHWETGKSFGDYDTWFIPEIGIIRSNLFKVNDVDTISERWELIECSVVEETDSVNQALNAE